ncbi:MAG: tetratricopeptide repeat protein [Candidatus Brocadiae bacterium]|nr:tetratricopeptide repeat protein [Candidatus Brocadiia bacterium]
MKSCVSSANLFFFRCSPPWARIHRNSVLAELAALLPEPAGRLVTLTGPAGIGKSRLAREVARHVLRSFPGGCWLVDLSGARTAVDIAAAAARVLGAPIEQNAPVEALADVLRFRNPLLLILDGAESLTAEAPAVLGPWMREARQARFLVTSRVLLGLSGERDIPVRPLDLPSGPRDPAASPAVALFAERALAAAPGFTLSEESAPHVLSICRALDGIPLSIEIAASRLRDLPIERVARELQQGAGALHDQGSAAAVTWSLASLAPWERAALRQLATFRGGFFLEAAEAVVDLSGFEDAPLVIDAIQTLCDQSFLRTDDLAQGTRFILFRQVQELSLREGRDEAAARRHTEWVLRHGREWTSRVHSPRAREAIEQLDAERDNLSAAMERTGGEVAAGLILAYEDALTVRGSMLELERMQSRVLQDPDLSDASRVRLEVARSSVLLSLGQYALACESAARALRPAPSGTQAHARIVIGMAWMLLGSQDEAREEMERALVCARAAGDVKEEATALVRAATILDQQGHPEEALDLATRGLEIDRQLGSPLLVARDTGILGMILGHVGRTDEALQVLEETRRFAAELGHRAHEASVTGNMGTLIRNTRPLEALRLHAESEAIFRDLGRSTSAALQTYNRGRTCFDLGRLDEAVECLEACLAHAESGGNRIRSIWYGSVLGMALSAHGDHDRAVRVLGRAVEWCREAQDPREEAACRVRRAHALFRAGRPVEPADLPDAGSVSDDRSREAGILFELLALRALLAARSGDPSGASAQALQILRGGVPPALQAHHWTAGLHTALLNLAPPGSP